MDDISTTISEYQLVQHRRYNAINKNIGRLAIVPAQRISRTTTTNNNQPSITNADQLAANLSPTPKNLYLLWAEWQTGIGGRKPAKEFTREERGKVKCKYTRRKVVWDQVSRMIRSGLSADVAIEQIYTSYGQGSSVTDIINRLRFDKKHNRLPQSLHV